MSDSLEENQKALIERNKQFDKEALELSNKYISTVNKVISEWLDKEKPSKPDERG